MQAYIARIEEVNPILNVITELNPDALGIAANLDAEREKGTTRGLAFFFEPANMIHCIETY